MDTLYIWIQERVQDGDLSIKKVPTAKNCANVGAKSVFAFRITTILQVCKIGFLLTMDPTLHTALQDDDDVPTTEPVTESQHRNEQLSTLVVNIDTDVQS